MRREQFDGATSYTCTSLVISRARPVMFARGTYMYTLVWLFLFIFSLTIFYFFSYLSLASLLEEGAVTEIRRTMTTVLKFQTNKIVNAFQKQDLMKRKTFNLLHRIIQCEFEIIKPLTNSGSTRPYIFNV